MTQPPLIALYSSAPQSGKSTVAGVLEASGYRTFKFASALKDMIRSLFRSSGMGEMDIEEHLEGSLKEAPLRQFGGLSSRQLMQTLGTDWGRQKVSNSLWIDLLAMRVTSALQQGYRVVVDDMRFPNEYFMLKSLGAKMLHVKRPSKAKACGHPSEGLLDDYQFDNVLVNNLDVSHLKTAASVEICRLNNLLLDY